MIMYLKIIACCILCGVMFYADNRLFRASLAVDPEGLYDAPSYFAQANGAAVLYMIIACAGIVLGTLFSVWGLWICAGLLVFLLAVDAVKFFRTYGQMRKNLKTGGPDTPEKKQARAMFRITARVRVLYLAYGAALTALLLAFR